MLKRIFAIALLTGTGQVFVIFALKYISQHSSPEQVKTIGQIDSLVLFIMNIVALGLQPAAMRNLALTENWKQEYQNTQSARLTLSIFIAGFALLAFIDQFYLAFLIAPLLALSGDYALYGRGYPIKAALIAFIRTVIPLFIILIINDTWQLSWLYFSGLLLAYLITNLVISFSLKAFHLPKISFSSLKMYVSTLSLGFVSLGLYFIGIGIILVAQYFYSAPELAIAFIGLKFYVIYKGILRILHQAFFKEMINEDVCLKIDQLSIVGGIIFLGSVLIFPGSFIQLFFGEQYLKNELFFIALGLAAFIYSMFLSMATRSMLLKKDRTYTITTIAAAVVTIILTIIFSFFYSSAFGIALSILIGELLWMFGLLKIIGTPKDIQSRMVFVLQCLLFLLIPLSMRYLIGDLLWVYATSFGVFIVIQLFLHSKKLKIFSQS